MSLGIEGLARRLEDFVERTGARRHELRLTVARLSVLLDVPKHQLRKALSRGEMPGARRRGSFVEFQEPSLLATAIRRLDDIIPNAR